MAVFVSATDESAGKNRNEPFIYAGWIARQYEWSEILTPAWQRLVLNGPPKIEHFHMTEMRSRQWKLDHGLSDEDAEKRIDAAVAIINNADFLYPLGVTVSQPEVANAFAKAKIKYGTKRSRFVPDYLCFLGYAMMAVEHVATHHKDCEKLDFIVERNGKVTDYICGFHATLKHSFVELQRPDLARMIGELIPVDKDGIPAQMADILCWHEARRFKPETMTGKDRHRHELLCRGHTVLATVNKQMINELAIALLAPKNSKIANT